ncbi:uncharacterized protein LOC106871313 [Octopus bimaculoides]|uniref:Uncharacterized protein n=1 Tax=Octopus bimaculoides TaxID=37653 RepID=A0A0L8HF12_OCTBM|nr:uncharacterized protein LOC106871313 [Octopus bimaculoides]|eukprot:XP_014773184.1 PREDICTED: uncharacterized protein LOC106871313 [Octopus bimaculoides]
METNADRDEFQPPVEHEDRKTSMERNPLTIMDKRQEKIDSLKQIKVTHPSRDLLDHGRSNLMEGAQSIKLIGNQPDLAQTISNENVEVDNRIPSCQYMPNRNDKNLREHNLSEILEPLENHSQYTKNFNNYKICRSIAPGVEECLILETGEHVKWDKNKKLCKARNKIDEDLPKSYHLKDDQNRNPVEAAHCSVDIKMNEDSCSSVPLCYAQTCLKTNSQSVEISGDISSCQNKSDIPSNESIGINQPKKIFKILKHYTDNYAKDSSQKESKNFYHIFGEKPLGAIPKDVKGIDSATAASIPTNTSPPDTIPPPNFTSTPSSTSTTTGESPPTESKSSSHETDDNFIYGIYILEEYLKDMQSLCKKNWQIIQRAKDVFYNQLLPSGIVSHKDDFLMQRSLNDDCPELNKSTYFIPKTFLRLGFQQSLQSNISMGNLQPLGNQPDVVKKDVTSPQGSSSMASSENTCKSQQENSCQNANNANIFQIAFQNSQKFKILEENRILKNELRHLQSSLLTSEKHLSGAKEEIQKLNEHNKKLDDLVRNLSHENKMYCEMINSLSQREGYISSQDDAIVNLASTLKITDKQEANGNMKCK